MKVSIKKSILENMLLNIQPYLEKKDLSQITSHVLLMTEESQFVIKATDYEIGLCYHTPEVKIITAGNATANGKKLLDIIKGLKDDEVILETINNYLYIKQNSSKFKLPMLNPSDFPPFPQIDAKPKFDINSNTLVRSIKKIAPAIDSNNPKFELNGSLIDIKDNSINLVATDTKRLAIVQLEQPTEHNFTLIIPKKAISEIQKLFFDTIEIFYDENTLIASSAHFTFYTKLINGKFPDYQRIIPKNKNYRILLSRESMVESIKQISIISPEIKITFKPEKIVFESLNDDNIEAKTEIEFKTGLDSDIYLAVNSRYILDFLSNIENSNFTLGFNDSGLPFTLESDNFTTIVMPIMI
ncbi:MULTISPECIES: DNA polymerase III subunit beta [unclassified Sulfurospirillum]|uniref:DNA polymerase III subunit beta n=1 Tax=unclassified Sulfurospirillum TaxID=2618290 RepID=UPI0005069A62|nr:MULTISPECIES: DNA polymerase III subunit beta [unclassified Sulfurospirillum]KFL33755.1 DNA polymerase III subunit beta [Sulfurospirillum sp. SCADC]